MSSTTMTIRVPLDISDKLERLARGTRRSSSYLATAAITAYVEREMDIIEGVQQGLADMEAGRVTSHDDVTAQAQQIIANARQRKATRG